MSQGYQAPVWIVPIHSLVYAAYIDRYDHEKFTLIEKDCATMPDKEVVSAPLVIDQLAQSSPFFGSLRKHRTEWNGIDIKNTN